MQNNRNRWVYDAIKRCCGMDFLLWLGAMLNMEVQSRGVCCKKRSKARSATLVFFAEVRDGALLDARVYQVRPTFHVSRAWDLTQKIEITHATLTIQT